PRQEYRDHAELVLPIELPVAEAQALIREALANARTLAGDKGPDIHVLHYAPTGITYRIKYLVPQHDRELVCRNEVFSLVDQALREKGVPLTTRPPQDAA